MSPASSCPACPPDAGTILSLIPQLRLRMSDLPLGSDDLDSDDRSSSSSMLTTSSSNSNETSTTNVSTLSSKAEVLHALQTAQNSYLQSASHVRFFSLSSSPPMSFSPMKSPSAVS